MHLQPALDLDGPVELDDLDRAVLWAMRSVAVGRADCPSLRRTFADLYGPRADQILCGLLVMVRLLANRSAGGIRLHMPGSSAVSHDEILILAALTVMQGETPNEALGEASGEACGSAGAGLADVLGEGCDASLVSAFHYVADLLSGHGRRLSAPVLSARAGADTRAGSRDRSSSLRMLH